MSAEEESELVYHGLHDVLEVRPHGLELPEVAELVLQQGRPPADGKVFAVHAVVLAQFGDPVSQKQFFVYSKLRHISYEPRLWQLCYSKTSLLVVRRDF